MPRTFARAFTASSNCFGTRMLICSSFFSNSNRAGLNCEKSRLARSLARNASACRSVLRRGAFFVTSCNLVEGLHRSAPPSSRGPRLVALHSNLLLTASRPGNVPGILHPHQRVHIDAERLLESKGHLPGQIGPAFRRLERVGRDTRSIFAASGHGKVVSFDDFGPQKTARMNRIRIRMVFSLVIVFIVHIP